MRRKPVKRASKRKRTPVETGAPSPVVPVPPPAAPHPPFLGWFLPLAAWAAFSLVMLTFPNANWLFPPSRSWFFHESFFYVLLTLLALATALKWTPAPFSDGLGDVNGPWARLLLPLILALGAYLRLYHASTPMLSYWDDPAREITWGRRLFDLGDYSEAFVFERGHSSAEPLFMYWISLLWHFVPDWKSLVVQRLAETLVDSATILLMYLLGKEIANRRVGLLLALMGALSKAMVVICIDGLRAVTTAFGVVLALWAFFRLVNKPGLSRFLQWGAAVAVGTYTYSSYRPMLPFFLLAALAWAWVQQGKEGRRKPVALVAAVLVSLWIYTWYTVAAGATDNWVSRVTDVSGLWLPCTAAAVLMLMTVRALRQAGPGGGESPLMGWALGCLLCVLLTFPIMTDHTLLEKTRDSVHFDQSGWDMMRFLWDKARQLCVNLFWENMNTAQNDFGLGTDSFFGFSEAIVVALGLAFLAARPTWAKTFLFAAGFMGVSNFFIPNYSYDGRVMGCVVPLLALGALGVDELLRRFLGGRGMGAKAAVLLILAAFTLWTAQGTLSRAYAQFAEVYQGGPMFERMRAYQGAMRDQDKGLRVYIDGELAHCIETGGGPEVLFEGRPVYTWHASNTVFLPESEPLKDLSIYLAPNSAPLKDPISKAFPKTQWEEVRAENISDKPLAAYHCVIPATDAESAQGPASLLLKVVRVPGAHWTRDYFDMVNGIGMGVISAEDMPAQAVQPAPPEAGTGDMNHKAVRLRSVIHVAQEGRYDLDCTTENLTLVRVDGRRVMDLKFHKTEHFDFAPQNLGEEKTLHLSAGSHDIEVILGIQRNQNYPTLTLKPSGEKGIGKSLWDSFEF